MIYVAISIHFILAFLSYLIFRSVFHPVFLFSTIWGLAISFLALLGDFFYELSELSLLIFSCGALFLTMGACLGKSLIKKRSSLINGFANKNRTKIIDLSIIIILIIFPFYIERISSLSALSGIDEFWKGLRFQTSSGASDEAGLGIFGYFGACANFFALIACNEFLNDRYSKRKAAFLVLLVFIYGLASTARTGVLTLLLSLASVFFINKKVSFVGIFTGFAVFLILFILPAVFLDKGGSIDNSFSENLISLFENLKIYALAGIVAFSEITNNLAVAPDSNGMFSFFLNVMRAIGFDVEVKSPVLSYTSTPWPTNVYTIYFQYYIEFGLMGVILTMTLIGAVISIFYELALRKIPEFVVLNALATAFIVISVFSESFFTALSYWLQLIIFLFIFYRVFPRIHLKRQQARL